jgi:hypothetical protein
LSAQSPSCSVSTTCGGRSRLRPASPATATSSRRSSFFIFGGIYGFRQIERDFSDTVIALDADGEKARISLWRPLRRKHIDSPLSALTGWRREIRTPRRNVSVDTLVADHPNHPRPLLFEMGKGIVTTDTFRALTPPADSVNRT